MRVPTINEMRAINEFLDGAARSLQHWQSQAGKVEMLRTMHALNEAMKVLGYEVAEARERFDNSGRRPKNRRR